MVIFCSWFKRTYIYGIRNPLKPMELTVRMLRALLRGAFSIWNFLCGVAYIGSLELLTNNCQINGNMKNVHRKTVETREFYGWSVYVCVLWAVSQSTIRILQVYKIYECLFSLIPNGFMKWIKFNKLNPTPSALKRISFCIDLYINRRHCTITYAKIVYAVHLDLCLVLDDCVLCTWFEELINIDIVFVQIFYDLFIEISIYCTIKIHDNLWL